MRAATLPAILVALGSATGFEALTVPATQIKAVRAVSPWQDDPYDVFVSFAMVAVALLAVVIAARLAVWRAPGGADRPRQTARAAGALVTLIWTALAFAWAAVAAGAHRAVWNSSTAVLVAGLAGQSLLASAAAVALWRSRSPRAATGGWRHDWLGDVALLVRRLPVAWIRRHATGVFAAASLLAAAGIVGAQAVGEGWRDPLLIGWALTVEATTMFAFCVAANAAAGFIARPARTRSARTAETSVLAGTGAMVAVTAFRDPLWTALTGGPVNTVAVLVSLTAGAGLAASALIAVVLAARPDGAAG